MVQRLLITALITALTTAFSFSAKADVLFEGYSKIMSGGVHTGYIVIRYEFDNKKKQFISTSFLKTGELGGNMSESLKAVAAEDLKPISYQYTTLIGKQTKTIDATFKKNRMTASVRDGSKVEKIIKDLPKGAFLSTFLAYVMLKSKQGLSLETKYDYEAIAEEDAALYKGIAFIKNEESFNGMKAMKVLNEFKSNKFISLINNKGEVYSTKSPAQSINIELMAQPSLATGAFPVPSALLANLFGEVPMGQKNEVSKKAQESTPLPKPIPGKQFGIPGGKGIQLKAEPPQVENQTQEKKTEEK